MSAEPAYSFVIPTYKRPDVLALCLEHLTRLDYDLGAIEVLVIDNAEAENTRSAAEPFRGRLALTYQVNEKNRGPGGSINRGLEESKGRRIVIMNDDALVPPSFLSDLDAAFDSDPSIGCVGVRVVEKDYYHSGEGVGRIDPSGEVIGNFDTDTGGRIEVEHVYGFCYAISRRAHEASGPADLVLLATLKASGDRLETDHCLSIRRAGFRVIFDPAIVVQHLAKPRLDVKERSPRWRHNHLRNTLYLFLKHFGLFGKRAVALRFTFTEDVGLISLLKRPSRENLVYFLRGLGSRISAYYHYGVYLFREYVVGRRRAPRTCFKT